MATPGPSFFGGGRNGGSGLGEAAGVVEVGAPLARWGAAGREGAGHVDGVGEGEKEECRRILVCQGAVVLLGSVLGEEEPGAGG